MTEEINQQRIWMNYVIIHQRDRKRN